jgi:hypothetical protein
MSKVERSAGEAVNAVLRVMGTRDGRIRLVFDIDVETAMALIMRILRAVR